MSAKLPVAIAAIGMFALLGAFALPPAIDATQNEDVSVVVVQEGNTTDVTDGLEVRNDDSTNTQATLTFFDTETGVSENITLQQGESGNVTLNNEVVNVTLDESTNSDAQVTVSHAHTYGWDDGAKTMAEQLDVILVVVAFVMLLGGIGWVIDS